MGVYGSRIEDITLSDISYRRKPSRNLPLKGYRFDLSPCMDWPEVPADCGLYVCRGVSCRDIDLNGCRMIKENHD